MAITSEKILPVGMRLAHAFALNANGRPAATGTTAYEGVKFEGPKAFTLNVPEPRKITHVGSDRVLGVDWLPAQEAVTGEIRTGSDNFALDALLSNVKVVAQGESELLPISTDQQGNEPQIGLLLYQQALGLTSKLRRWRYYLVPNAKAIPLNSGFSDNPEDMRYSIAVNPVSKYLWGVTLTLATEGAEEAGLFKGYSAGRPKLVAYLGDNTEDEFLFPVAAPATDVDTILVYVNGAAVTTNITKALTGVTFTTAPAAGADINIFYEW